MKKLLAILLSVLMLCTVIPMGAMSVTAAVGTVVNGDFETGEATPWTLYGNSEISADAAYEGDYGLICNNPTGNWGGTAYQDFTVEVGKTYVVTMWAKAISQGQNIQIQNPVGTTAASKWFETTEWTKLTFTFTATDATVRINIGGGGTGAEEVVYFDNIGVKELEISSDGYITNGDFETGEVYPWTLYGNSEISADAAYEGDYGLICNNPTGNWGGTAYQDFTVEVGKTYVVTMWAKAISQGQNIQIQNPVGTNAASKWFKTTEWTELTFTFTATDATVRINICGGGTGAEEVVYFDNIKVKELKDPSFDGYITNGDFETGEVSPWNNLWGSCPTVEIVEGGMDSDYALNVVSKKWCHVRQIGIAVEADTWYKVTVWAKNTSDIILLVKDDGDSANLNQTGMTAGDEWTEFTGVFNSGDYTSVIVSLMGGENDEIAEKYGIFDNISMEKHEHTYDNESDADCNECGDVREVEVKEVLDQEDVLHSVMDTENGNGLAFRFNVNVDGIGVVSGTTNMADYSNATVRYNGEVYRLVGMGAMVTNRAIIGENESSMTMGNVNGATVIDIPAVYLCDLELNSCAFAVRIVDIPDSALNHTVYTRPYYIIEADGVQITIYGAIDSISCQEVLDSII